ncbi:DNA repair protein RecO [Rhodobacteraceae bacterium NNCM2]|nr:DNA repair protein RecO [Coraliihabitans acroporae]
MITWRDQGLLLSVRRHGETSAIIDVLTEGQGRYSGLVRGGASAKMTPVLQPGAQLSLEWQARLADHLGAFKVEPVRSRAGTLMGSRARLAAFNSMAALLLAFVPEREPDRALYEMSVDLADALATGDAEWSAHYVVWELGLLGALGFQLDLAECAATGSMQELIWVSPKSGRAVSRDGGAGWEDRLLPLPGFLRGVSAGAGEVPDGLRLTGYFLTNWALPPTGLQRLPEARARLTALLQG